MERGRVGREALNLCYSKLCAPAVVTTRSRRTSVLIDLRSPQNSDLHLAADRTFFASV